MKVVTFGELMIRLQPFNYERFVQANNLEFTFGEYSMLSSWINGCAGVALAI